MVGSRMKTALVVEEELQDNSEYDETIEMSPIYTDMPLLDELAMTYFNYKRDGVKTLPISLPPVEWVKDIMPYGRKSRTPHVKMKSFDGILLHSTGNRKPSSTARNNVRYTNTSEDLVDKLNSYHCCIDNNEIVQCIPFEEKAYSAAKFNDRYIAIEVAENGTDKESTTRQLTTTWVYAAQFCAFLLNKYCKVSIGKKASDYVITHAYVNIKKANIKVTDLKSLNSKMKLCPNNMLINELPFSFETFCHLIDLFFIP